MESLPLQPPRTHHTGTGVSVVHSIAFGIDAFLNDQNTVIVIRIANSLGDTRWCMDIPEATHFSTVLEGLIAAAEFGGQPPSEG